MILADDNFATIVTAIGQGRNIYNNIRKTVVFLLTCNLGEVITIFVAILIGWSAPLIATQLLWINLLTEPGATRPGWRHSRCNQVGG